jgi:hypothetical protein
MRGAVLRAAWVNDFCPYDFGWQNIPQCSKYKIAVAPYAYPEGEVILLWLNSKNKHVMVRILNAILFRYCS